MVRYYALLFMNMVMAVFVYWYMLSLKEQLNLLNSLRSFLFLGEMDPTVLDSKATYSCTPSPSYSLSSLSSDQDALQFYSHKWTNLEFNKTLEYSMELVCFLPKAVNFGKVNGLILGLFFSLIPFTVFIQMFRRSRERVPLSKLLCREDRFFELLLICQLFLLEFFLLPTATAEAAKMNGSTLTAKEFTNFIIAYHILQPYGR